MCKTDNASAGDNCASSPKKSRKKGGRWTRERIKLSATPYGTKAGWRAVDPNGYAAAHRAGLLDDLEITGHMVAQLESWTRERIKESAAPYGTKAVWKKGDLKGYSIAKKRGLLNDPEITGHMIAQLESWSYEKIKASAKPYSTKATWKKGDLKGYGAAHRGGLLNDPEITGHMVSDWSSSTHIYIHILATTECGQYIAKAGVGQGDGRRRSQIVRSHQTHLPEFFSGESIPFDLGNGETANMLQVPCEKPRTVEALLLTIGEPITYEYADGRPIKPEGHTETRLFTEADLLQALEIMMENATQEAA